MNNLFKNKRVLVFGLGLNQGGLGSAKFFVSQGAKVRVTDLKSAKILKPSLGELKQFPQIKYTLGEHKYDDIDWADLIIKNPAVKPGNPYMEYALKHEKQVEMDMGIFLDYLKSSQLIGITGTKGKSTTSSLIYEVLKSITHKKYQKSAGVNTNPPQGMYQNGTSQGCPFKKVILAGNIGKSVLDTIPYVEQDTLVVLEISSFQLEAFDQHQVSPKWAVITNITPDHLNYYKTMEDYVKAKKVIGKYQTQSDYLFLRKDDPVTTKHDFLKDFKGQIVYFSKDDLPKDFHPKLIGEHNRQNIASALGIARVFGLDDKIALNILSNFQGIPFRMQLIKTWNGVKIYNDTTATSPEAGIQAIKTASRIGSGNVVLICGGMNKGMDYKDLAKTIDEKVKRVFFLEGDSTKEIKRLLKESAIIAGTYNDLEKLLKDIKKIIQPGDVILFSPAATSFNLFQNEFDRGRKFNTAVEKVFTD